MQASSPMVGTWKQANKVVRDMKGIDIKLLYKKLKGSKWLISVSNGYEPIVHGDCCVVSWKSAKVKQVVSSTNDSEILALSEGLEEAIVMRKLLLDKTGFPDDMIQVEGWCDNDDTMKAINMCETLKKGTRINLEVAKLRQMLDTKEMKPFNGCPSISIWRML